MVLSVAVLVLDWVRVKLEELLVINLMIIGIFSEEILDIVLLCFKDDNDNCIKVNDKYIFGDEERLIIYYNKDKKVNGKILEV